MNHNESGNISFGFFRSSNNNSAQNQFYRSQSNITLQSSNCSSSTKRQREDDCSSDGTLSSTFSLPTSSDNVAFQNTSYQTSYRPNSNNESHSEGYPTSSFKRMKLEHNTNGVSHTTPEFFSHSQSHEHEQTQNTYLPTSVYEDTNMSTDYDDNHITRRFPADMPPINEQIQRTQIQAPITTSGNDSNDSNFMQYSSVNKLLGSLHRNRRHRQTPIATSSPTTSFPSATTMHNLSNSALNEGMNLRLQHPRRQNKRSILQTTSSLY